MENLDFGFWFFIMPAIGAAILFASFIFVAFYYLIIVPQKKEAPVNCDHSSCVES